ncbi:MAG: hypothetical protein Tsb009_35950 [Planctomycetaceae bacterium]
MCELPDGFDLMQVEDAIWILTSHTGNPAYDFAFDSSFICRRPWERKEPITAIGRFGASPDYEDLFARLKKQNIRLANSPEQHFNGSELPQWYPLLEGLTPKSVWFDEPPSAKVVEETVGWPVFVKGARQTSRHELRKCVAHNPAEYEKLIDEYRQDSILKWQQCVVREFANLRSVNCEATYKVPPSFEFRTFWYNKKLVGAGPYWSEFADYTWTSEERDSCIELAASAAAKIDCPFLVIDMALKDDGQWIVIECNDGQESGYAGVSPFAIWNNIVQQTKASAFNKRKPQPADKKYR